MFLDVRELHYHHFVLIADNYLLSYLNDMSLLVCFILTSQTVTPMTSSQIRAPWQPQRLPTMLSVDKTHHQRWAAVRNLGQRLFTSSPQKWQTSKACSTLFLSLFNCSVFSFLCVQSSEYSYFLCSYRAELQIFFPVMLDHMNVIIINQCLYSVEAMVANFRH